MLLQYLKSRLNFRLDNATNRLIVINVAIWLLMIVLRVFCILFNMDFEPLFLEVPSNLYLFLQMPWTLLTYSFMHVNFGHILFNMIALYWFGHITEEHYSSWQITVVYLLGGMAGGALFLLAFNTLPFFTSRFHDTFLLGASASVLAITAAAAIAEPSRKLHLFLVGEVSLKWLAVIMIVISFLGVTGSNAGGDIAHLGGALLGVCYALAERQLSRHISRHRNIFTNHKQTNNNTADFHFQRGTRQQTQTHDHNWETQNDIDRILDKIKQTGYASLTDDEKRKLFKH